MMYSHSCSFVSYLTVNNAKSCFCARQSYFGRRLVLNFSAENGMNERTGVNGRIKWTHSRHRASMKIGNERNERFQDLERDIENYIANLAEDIPNPLSYVNLRKAGRIDLVSRIIDAGGYVEVSKRLGVPVDETKFVPPPNVSEGGRFEPFRQTEDQGASIAIGRSLEERMKSSDNPAKRDEPSKSATQASNQRKIEAVPSAADLIEQNSRIVTRVVDEPSVEGENLSLTIRMRLGLLTLSVIAAIGFGKTSSTVVDPSIISTSKSIAGGLAFAHSLLALYCAVLVAPRMHRSSTLWFIKVLLGGPLAVVELQSLDSLEDSR